MIGPMAKLTSLERNSIMVMALATMTEKEQELINKLSLQIQESVKRRSDKIAIGPILALEILSAIGSFHNSQDII
jgi:hypothetical protein